jgi:hypothetical protein
MHMHLNENLLSNVICLFSKIPGKPPHKGARTRAKAFVECSGKEKGKKNLNKMVEVDTAFVLEKRY